jgi:hypothetical protein
MSTVPSLLWTVMTTVTAGSSPRHDRNTHRRADGPCDNPGFGEALGVRTPATTGVLTLNDYMGGVISGAS